MKKVIIRNVTIASSLLIILVAFQNCGQVQNSMQFASSIPPAPESVVCGGFDSEEEEVQRFGIMGNIFTATQSTDPGFAVKYPTHATPLKTEAGDLVTIYLNNVDVPTRSFTQGFVNQNGDALKDNDGNVLIEYFGLKLDYVLTLPDDFEPGYYQIGIESDDGSLLKILDTDNSMKTHIDNDGIHSTRAKCASKALYFDHTTKIPSQLFYYQGPRTEIAMRLFWKKVNSENPNSACGSIGLADGSAGSNYWKIIPPTAFELPGNQEQNPCAD